MVWPYPTGNPRYKIAWASPAQPRPHVLPVPNREYYSVRIVGRRVAFERGTSAGDVPRAQVGIVDLDGNLRILATGASMGVLERRFDFDGKRVAWYAFACKGVRIHVQPVGSKVIHESMKRCPLRFKRPPRIREQRRVDLAVDCYGYGQGCEGRNAVLMRRQVPHTVVGRGKNAHRIKLTDEGLRLLESHEQMRLRARITMTDLAGTRERRRGSVTLQRP